MGKFNLTVTEFRLQNGISEYLKKLYKEMGNYSEGIEKLIGDAKYIKLAFEQIFLKVMVG